LRKSHSIALSEKRWITKSYSDGWKGFKYAKDVEELKMRYCRTYIEELTAQSGQTNDT